MIISREDTAVLKSSGELVTNQASIVMTPEMLHVLSSGIYKYKIRAVIRELSTNALDAHIAKGIQDRPICVTLPDGFDNDLVIRDYGFGMNYDEVMDSYLTYGLSTKSSSNDYVGAMGLGCKSPFAYTDAYTVESIQNGSKNIYTVYKENGFPQITILVKDLPTTEEDGLAVRVPITAQDVHHCNSEAIYVFQTFDVYPLIISSKIDIVQDTEVFLGSRNGAYYVTSGRHTNVYAVMGQIRYPISKDDYKFGLLGSLLSGKTLWLNFNIGDVAMAASREELQMTPETTEKVQKALDQINESLLEEAQYKVYQEDNPLNAILMLCRDYAMSPYSSESLKWETLSSLLYDETPLSVHYYYMSREYKSNIYDDNNILIEKGDTKFSILTDMKRHSVASNRSMFLPTAYIRNLYSIDVDTIKKSCYSNIVYVLQDSTTLIRALRELCIANNDQPQFSRHPRVVVLVKTDQVQDLQVHWEETYTPVEYRHLFKLSDYRHQYVKKVVCKREKKSLVQVTSKMENVGFAVGEVNVDFNELLEEGEVIVALRYRGTCVNNNRTETFYSTSVGDIEIISDYIDKPIYIVDYTKVMEKKLPEGVIYLHSEEFYDTLDKSKLRQDIVKYLTSSYYKRYVKGRGNYIVLNKVLELPRIRDLLLQNDYGNLIRMAMLGDEVTYEEAHMYTVMRRFLGEWDKPNLKRLTSNVERKYRVICEVLDREYPLLKFVTLLRSGAAHKDVLEALCN